MHQFQETIVATPSLSIILKPDGRPRCRRCASLLITTHVACDDGALIPIVYCPVCSHSPKAQPRPVVKAPRSADIIVDLGLAARGRQSHQTGMTFADD